MKKKRRVYQSRVVGGQVMMQADLERLHKYMREIERVDGTKYADIFGTAIAGC
jgi:hypothetical protein